MVVTSAGVNRVLLMKPPLTLRFILRCTHVVGESLGQLRDIAVSECNSSRTFEGTGYCCLVEFLSGFPHEVFFTTL